MIENDLHNQELNLYEEKRSGMAANLNSIIAPLLHFVFLLFDTLHFLLAPGEMLRRIEGEFDQQIHSSREEVNEK